MKRWLTLLIVLVLFGILAIVIAFSHQPSDTEQNASPFFVLLGICMIGTGLFSPQLNRWMGLPERSSVFTNPRFQRSARTVEIAGRIIEILLGVGFLIQGVGDKILTGESVFVVSLLAAGLAGIGTLIMFGVVVANWRA